MTLSDNFKKQLGPIWGLCAPMIIMIAILFFQSNSTVNADGLTISGGTISMDVSTNGATFPSGVWNSSGKIGIGTTTTPFSLNVVGDTRTDSVILKSASSNNCYKIVIDDDGIESKTHVSCANGTLIGHTMTVNGNAQITTAQSQFGGASGLFDGTGDWIQTPNSTDFDFGAVGSGDFTISFWVRFNSVASTQEFIGTYKTASGWQVYWHNTNGLTVWNGTGTAQSRAWSPSTGIWYHVAVIRNGGDVAMYVNGSKLGASLTDRAWNSEGVGLSIGSATVDSAPAPLNGWMDELSIQKGTARWTSNFTPPLSAFSCHDTNTVLLIHMDSSTRFTDNSGC